MTVDFGIEDKEIVDVLFFQDLDIETLSFESPSIIGKYYGIKLKEYKTQKLLHIIFHLSQNP